MKSPKGRKNKGFSSDSFKSETNSSDVNPKVKKLIYLKYLNRFQSKMIVQIDSL